MKNPEISNEQISSKSEFCSAVEVKVTRRESVDGWSKYQLMVLAVYKRNAGIRLRHGEQSLWISGKRTACKCPKIQVGKKYLILGLSLGNI